MYTAIISTYSGTEVIKGESPAALCSRAESINDEWPGSVYWYTILDTATGEQVESYLINEGA